jgi:hypothetical protein
MNRGQAIGTTGRRHASKYSTISADGHLECPRRLSSNVAEPYRDVAPSGTAPGGRGDSWLIEGSPLVHTGTNLTAGEPLMMRGGRTGSRMGAERPVLATQLNGSTNRIAMRSTEVLFPPIFVVGRWRI